MIPVLETPRLLLTPVSLADAPRTQEIFPRWEIVRYMAAHVPWPYPPGAAEQYYREQVLPAVARGDEWHWVLRLKASPEQHIGALALYCGDENNRGFWLGFPWQGRGLMTEAVFAANDFWFDTLGMPALRAPKALDNIASRRISEKTGMRVLAATEKDFVSGRLASEVWECTAQEWRKVRAASTRA